MIRKPIRTSTRILLSVAAFAVLVAFYAWLSYRQHLENPKDTTIPGWSQLQEGWGEILSEDSSGEVWLWEDLRATYGRLLVGLTLGVVLSVVVGVAMGVSDHAAAFFGPPLSVFGKIPPTAMLAVYFVLVGTELEMYAAMIALGIFPSLAASIAGAARKDVTEHAIDKAYTLGASHYEVVYEVVWKQILPRVIENVRLQIGPAMVFLIAAEMLTADVGFGYRLRIQSRLLHMNVVYTYLLILGVTGLAIDWALMQLRRRLCRWFGD